MDGVDVAGRRHARALPVRRDPGWQPDIADLESKITERTKALVIINPNNPTGAVYSHGVLTQMVELARKHELLLLADEIYDKILYDDAKHINVATLAPDMLCLTFNGLSKAYRVAGYRAGWLAITGPKDHAESFIEGINLLANMRLCPNVPASTAFRWPWGPPEHRRPGAARRPAARAARRSVGETQRDSRVSCVKPEGALYAFPASTPRSTTSPTTNSSSSTCCCRRRSWSPRAPDSIGRHRITCAS